MRRKNFENIGKVAVNEITLCDTEIGLYIPIEKMSENIRREYEMSEKHFTETVNKEHPEIDLSQHTLYRDVALKEIAENNGIKPKRVYKQFVKIKMVVSDVLEI